MSEDKINDTKEAILKFSDMLIYSHVERVIMRNGANAINQLQQEKRKYKEVIDKLEDIINEMVKCGYVVENGESVVNYMATGSKSEFGTRAKVLLNILKEVE